MSDNLDYYRMRERQERERAERAEDTTAKCVHLELAERYSALVQDLGAGAVAA
ncbi:hypothetical protein RZN05_16660 [Sphingomonas sp. HF-S4]|uniref:Uncharacterized protein n=1 Tax=Sphingomonas agrestis TaxID=3080540 RepID=A0ABU3YBV7_9SPHN|nr:hypothetical protein [Sphingomonas sp. HF-S4]MDV3458632.1 hypothetical protein [Sphingomonas sp. HF-S4]